MNELTRGSIVRHLLTLAAPVLMFMCFQAVYVIVSLYFVAQLGDVAVAGVSTASNAAFVISSFTQVISVGTAALVAHAVGREDREDVALLMNQSLALSIVFAAVVMLGGYAFAGKYVEKIAADAATTDAAMSYLRWCLPGLALQFPLSSLSGTLRGGGVVRPTMVVYVVTILINIVLAPVLIVGWATGQAFGPMGAGLASSVSVAIGTVLLWIWIQRMRGGVVIDVHAWWPRIDYWRRILRIGLPAGADMASTFIYTAVVYWSIRRFGADAQAAFGASTRIMQALMMPAMAIALVSGPIAGQNFGAGDFARLRSALHSTLVLSVTPMIAAALLLYVAAGRLLEPFTDDPNVVALGSMCLQISAIVLVARGVIYACSGLLQGLGATLPPLLSSAAALGIFSVAVLWCSKRADFAITDIWYLSAAVFVLQAGMSLRLVCLDWRRRRPGRAVSQPGVWA